MSHTLTVHSISFSWTNSGIRAVCHPTILLLTPVYVPQQYFWGLTADCLALVTINISMPCLYYVHVSEWLIFVTRQQECFSTTSWSFTVGRFLWAVLNLQPFELSLCERKPPSLFQHLKGCVIIRYWKFLKHSWLLLDLCFIFCLMSFVRYLSFYGADCIRWQWHLAC